MSFIDIVAWAADLGLQTEVNADALQYQFHRPVEFVSFGDPSPRIDTEWLSAFEAVAFLREIQDSLEVQLG